MQLCIQTHQLTDFFFKKSLIPARSARWSDSLCHNTSIGKAVKQEIFINEISKPLTKIFSEQHSKCILVTVLAFIALFLESELGFLTGNCSTWGYIALCWLPGWEQAPVIGSMDCRCAGNWQLFLKEKKKKKDNICSTCATSESRHWKEKLSNITRLKMKSPRL